MKKCFCRDKVYSFFEVTYFRFTSNGMEVAGLNHRFLLGPAF